MMNENKYVEKNGMTVDEFFNYQLKIQKNNLKQGTYESYSYMYKKYLGSIANLKLQSVKPINIQNIYDKMISGELTGKNLSAKTVYNLNGYLHIVFSQALKLGLIMSNPVDACTLPKKRKFEIQPLNKKTMDIVLEHCYNEPYYLAFLLAMTTEMRKGEILGLKYSDIDLDSNIISVRRNRQRYGLDTLKTESSRRDISIPDNVKNEIKRNMGLQAQYEIEYGDLYDKNDFVIKDFYGNIREYGWLNKTLTKVLDELNIEHVRFHDLRHSHATYLVSHGVNMKIVQDRLGHSTISTTANVYSHPNVDAQKEALKGLF